MLACVVLVAGCAQTFDATTLGVPASMASAASPTVPDSAAAFSVSSHAMFGFWGMVSLKNPSVEKALAGQLVGGKRIENVRIKVRSSVSDVIFTVLTAGIIVPRSVTVEGTVTGP